MGALVKLAKLNHASSALAILKGRFYAHAPPILAHALRRGWSIGDEKPGFLISWLPTSTEPASKLMLLPQHDLSIPVLVRLGHKLLALLPVPIRVPKAPPPPLLIFNPQHVMPANPLAQLSPGQAGQSPIAQQSPLAASTMPSHFLTELPHDLPSSS